MPTGMIGIICLYIQTAVFLRKQLKSLEEVENIKVDSIEIAVAEQLEKSFQQMNITIDDSDEKSDSQQMRWAFGPSHKKGASKSVVV